MDVDIAKDWNDDNCEKDAWSEKYAFREDVMNNLISEGGSADPLLRATTGEIRSKKRTNHEPTGQDRANGEGINIDGSDIDGSIGNHSSTVTGWQGTEADEDPPKWAKVLMKRMDKLNGAMG